MAYEKQNLKDGQVLSADHINHIEDGILDVGKAIEELKKGVTGIVANEVKEAFASDTKDIDARVSRNDKRITNLEQGITPDPFVTDDTIAYTKNVPINALPYAEIKKVGGIIKYNNGVYEATKVTTVKSIGKNLFDINKIPSERGTVNNGDGTLTVTTYGFTLNVTLRDVLPYYNGAAVTLSFNTTVTKSNAKIIYLWESNRSLVSGGTYTFTEADLNSRLIFYCDEINGEKVPSIVSNIMFTYDTSVNGCEYTPYVEYLFEIPSAVHALEGYGESNPNNIEEYNYIDLENQVFVSYGYMENDEWVSSYDVMDISEFFSKDNFIEVEGGGTIVAVNEYGLAVPTEITYMLKT